MQVRSLSIGLFILTAALSAALSAQAADPRRPRAFRSERRPGSALSGRRAGNARTHCQERSFHGRSDYGNFADAERRNHIKQSTTAHLVRDSDGRTRREQSLNGLGALGTPAANTQAVFISDPVAGVSYARIPTTARFRNWRNPAAAAAAATASNLHRPMRPVGAVASIPPTSRPNRSEGKPSKAYRRMEPASLRPSPQAPWATKCPSRW